MQYQSPTNSANVTIGPTRPRPARTRPVATAAGRRSPGRSTLVRSGELLGASRELAGRRRCRCVMRALLAARARPRPTARRTRARSAGRASAGTRTGRRSRRRCGPGRALITSTRVDRNTASSIEWVMNSAAKPLRWNSRISSSFRRSRVISSRAPNGSSNRNTLGVEDERAGQRGAHLHAAGQLLRVLLLEPAAGRRARWPRRRGRARSACGMPSQLGEQLDVALHGAPLQQRGVLEHVAEAATGRPRPCRRSAG